MQTTKHKRKSQSYSVFPFLKTKGELSPLPLSPVDSVKKTTFSQLASNCNTLHLPKLNNVRHKSDDFSDTCSSIELSIPRLHPTSISNNSYGKVRAYAVNTHNGITRTYNEDKAVIILRVKNQALSQEQKWPECSFFGLYDGHGGHLCSNFLRDNLHHYIIGDPHFPSLPKLAIFNGLAKAESEFIDLAKSTGDKSGSCVLIVLIIGKICYIANIGDSRAILSAEEGKEAYSLSRDHIPSNEIEHNRIKNAGGQIYGSTKDHKGCRIIPGGLNVSRTIGDINAKVEEFGGIPNVISPQPEIRTLKITKDHDFILMGCDGIFDVLSTKDVIETVWKSTIDEENVSQACRKGVETVLAESMRKRSSDNLTAIMIAFSGFEMNCQSFFTSTRG